MFVQGDKTRWHSRFTGSKAAAASWTHCWTKPGASVVNWREDKARLDQYVTSVREVERLQTARAWELKPKPVARSAPSDIQDKLFFEVRPHALDGAVGAGVGLHAS
jgi:hypothetical protein